jgi:uncharacterized protein DUF3551
MLGHIPMEALMRIPDLCILTLATTCAAVPAKAQTYDPRYPICMKVYSGGGGGLGGGEWIDCSYVSLPQCHASAAGRAAMCEINPYFAHAQLAPNRFYRRPYPRY